MLGSIDDRARNECGISQCDRFGKAGLLHEVDSMVPDAGRTSPMFVKLDDEHEPTRELPEKTCVGWYRHLK